jgi:5-methylcytosine-specific restriction endonuclease McrA
MGKKLLTTPKSRVRAAIRNLWLHSRERASALKRDNYSCVHCGVKQCKKKGFEQKVEVHHLDGIDWLKIIEYIYRHVLVDPKNLETICPECHLKEHERDI